MRFVERRGAVDWTASPDVTEAEAASAAIEAWSARRSPTAGEAAGAETLEKLRDAMTRLVSHPTVRLDPICRSILARLDARSTLAELDVAMGEIAERVETLTARPAAPVPAVPAPPVSVARAWAGRIRALHGILNR